MADDEKEGGETSARGSDWEVVSLTASAYAAAPGHVGFELPADDKGMELSKDEDESSQAMFMSDHFGFTPSEHVDLPIESNNSYIMEGVGNQSGSADGQSGEILNESAGEGTDTPEVLDEEERGRVNQTAENWNVGKMQSSLKGLSEADSLQGIQFYEEKGKNLSAHGEDFDWIEPIQHSGVEEEQNLFTAAKLGSFHAESDRSGPTVGDDSVVASDLLKGDQESEDLSQWSLDSPKLPKEHKNDEQGLPCEAWWKRRAAAFYAQAKEANTIWSVVVAAALMGLVILGQRWQQERWQFQQLKWQFSINDEKINRMLGPVSRLKDAIVGGHKRSPVIRGGTSVER